MAFLHPSVTMNGLSPVSEDDSVERTARKLKVLRKIRPPPFKYAWEFYHDKHSISENYEGRLTLLQGDIFTLKPFWEVLNSFPLDALKLNDSVHFFKRGVKPVWEDRRNVNGGAWTFRIPKADSERFWKEVLLMAVGEQFADVIQPGDDLCGVSMSVRSNSNLITIWNRQGDNEKTKEGIRKVVRDKISADMWPLERNYYYKKHSEHAGFSKVLAKARELEADEGKIPEAEVKSAEGDKALLEEAEDMDLKDLK